MWYSKKFVAAAEGGSGWQRSCQRLNTFTVLAYKMIWLSMAKQDGAGRNEANLKQARECTR